MTISPSGINYRSIINPSWIISDINKNGEIYFLDNDWIISLVWDHCKSFKSFWVFSKIKTKIRNVFKLKWFQNMVSNYLLFIINEYTNASFSYKLYEVIKCLVWKLKFHWGVQSILFCERVRKILFLKPSQDSVSVTRSNSSFSCNRWSISQ